MKRATLNLEKINEDVSIDFKQIQSPTDEKFNGLKGDLICLKMK